MIMRNSKTQNFAKENRQNLTKAEAIIWKHIKGAKIEGVKFRRQHPIPPFIVDFAAVEIGLIIEIDGATHISEDELQSDKSRENYLKAKGFEIIRIRNFDIYNNLGGILEYLGKRVWELKTSQSFLK